MEELKKEIITEIQACLKDFTCEQLINLLSIILTSENGNINKIIEQLNELKNDNY